MQRGTLGGTGLPVSRMGLGLAALGRPGYINLGHGDDLRQDYDRQAMEVHAHAVLDAAYRGGVRYFDVARSYGHAEDFLASWLASRRLAPGRVAVGSKWGYTYTAAWRVDADVHEVKDHSLTVLQRQLAETRGRLGEHLALYQIHSATTDSGVLADDAVMDELARVRAGGVRIGLTLSGAAQGDALRRAIDVTRDGERLFDTVQATWNLLERSVEPPLRDAHAAGMGVIVKEALANGRLTSRNTDVREGAPLAALARESARLGATADAVALAAVLAQPWVDVVLSGAATPDQMASNLAALELRLDDEATERLRALAMEPRAYWLVRSALPWN